MTAIRNFPDAPLARPHAGRPLLAPLQDFGLALWRSLERLGRWRATAELYRLAEYRARRDPVLARQLRAAADECCRIASQPEPASRA